jgi:hypothetical protein
VTERAFHPLTVLVSLASALLVTFSTRTAGAEAKKDAEPESERAADAGKKEEEKTAEEGEGEGKQEGDEKEAAGEAKADADEKSAKGEGLGHAGQFGLRVGIVGGLTMVVRYENSGFCREPEDPTDLQEEQKFCGHMSPFALDFGLSFAPVDLLEPFLWGRFGLGGEEQTDTNPIIMVGAGVRLYTMSDALVKVFIEPAVALEFEDGQGHVPWSLVPDAYSTDIVFHLAAGPQFDFSRYVGLYITGGLTTGVIRSLHASLDLQAGLQGRYP